MSPQRSRRQSPADSSEAVDALMSALEHPHKPAIEVLRQAILGADPAIGEGVKWNAPSFRTHAYFGTVHLRARRGILLILHRDAKMRALPEQGLDIDDPDGLLHWLAADRAQVGFADAGDVQRRAPALQALLRQWIAAL